jgi:hypothetical protein
MAGGYLNVPVAVCFGNMKSVASKLPSCSKDMIRSASRSTLESRRVSDVYRVTANHFTGNRGSEGDPCLTRHA